jgi:hypothetical protein
MEAEIENLKGAISSRTAQRQLSAAAEPDRRRQTEMVTGRFHSAMPKAFWVTGHGQFLLQALAAAVDVASATERYAAACDVELQFTSEDLREIGLSIYTTGAK